MKKFAITIFAALLYCGVASAAPPANIVEGLVGPSGVVPSLLNTVEVATTSALSGDLGGTTIAVAASLGDVTNAVQSLIPASVTSQPLGLVAVLSRPLGNAMPAIPFNIVGSILGGDLQGPLSQLGGLSALAGGLSNAQTQATISQLQGLLDPNNLSVLLAGVLPGNNGLALPGL